jgi:hypothetical protein
LPPGEIQNNSKFSKNKYASPKRKSHSVTTSDTKELIDLCTSFSMSLPYTCQNLEEKTEKVILRFRSHHTMVFLPATAPQRMEDITTGNGKKHPK